MIYSEVERLNNILKTKNEEVNTLQSRYRTSEEDSMKQKRRN